MTTQPDTETLAYAHEFAASALEHCASIISAQGATAPSFTVDDAVTVLLLAVKIYRGHETYLGGDDDA